MEVSAWPPENIDDLAKRYEDQYLSVTTTPPAANTAGDTPDLNDSKAHAPAPSRDARMPTPATCRT
jgi:hypothetical protein